MMLKFICFLFEYLNTDDFSLIYSDTDSVTIGTAKTIQRDRKIKNGAYDHTRLEIMEDIFLPIVKPEKLDEFKSKWGDWFVLTNEIRDEKTTGKLKVFYKLKIFDYTYI